MDNTKPRQQCKKFNNNLWVSTQGDTWNTKLKNEGLSTQTGGYDRLTTGELLHRVVFETFVRKLNSYEEINHINGIKTDNRLENLEAVSTSENCKHRVRVLKRALHNNVFVRKLTDKDVIDICFLLKNSKDSIKSIARKYNVSDNAIHHINRGKNYSRITEARFNDYPIRSKA